MTSLDGECTMREHICLLAPAEHHTLQLHVHSTFHHCNVSVHRAAVLIVVVLNALTFSSWALHGARNN